MHDSEHHPLAFAAVLVGSVALSFGPWLVRLSGVGPVAAGFWRLALALPFLFAIAALTPWMDRWGATDAELQATFPGDELVTAPKSFVNHAVTINAKPEQIYPWLLQMGADKAGLYSYTALETAIACPQTNADRIHDEWQNLQVGDLVKLCPKEPGPPPYIVAQLLPNQAIVMGHKENGEWVDPRTLGYMVNGTPPTLDELNADVTASRQVLVWSSM